LDIPDFQLARQCAEALPAWAYGVMGLSAPGVAAWVDALIKQPAAGSLWLLVRKPLSILGGNIGWARNANQETLSEWWATNRQALAAWLLEAAGNALKAEAEKIAATTPAVDQTPASDPTTTSNQ
jgi:hypothetical protein